MLKDDFIEILNETVGSDPEHQPWINSIADRLVDTTHKYMIHLGGQVMSEIIRLWVKQ